MYHFCTYFDQNYLPRALALYQSLRQHCPSFQLWALCMDDASYEILTHLNLPEICLISLEEFERDDTKLLDAKKSRSRVEYYFTCSPSLPLFIFNHWPEVNLITYLDADLFFFADPAPIYDELSTSSIGIIAHRFAPEIKYKEKHGIYNVGWLSFRRDSNGLACLKWWREQCLEWCYDRPEEGRFGDQKYLDCWPDTFQGVIVLQHKGANLAPWNFGNYHLSVKEQNVWVDEHPLIFFHFQGLELLNNWLYNLNLTEYKVKPSGVVLPHIYEPYIKLLLELISQVSNQSGVQYRQIRQLHYLSWSRLRYTLRDLIAGSYVFLVKGHLWGIAK